MLCTSVISLFSYLIEISEIYIVKQPVSIPDSFDFNGNIMLGLFSITNPMPEGIIGLPCSWVK
jgi:hypothetical protein